MGKSSLVILFGCSKGTSFRNFLKLFFEVIKNRSVSDFLSASKITLHLYHNRYELSHISVLRPYFPGGKLNGFPSAPPNLKDLMTHSLHHLLPGLTGYLIRVAPLAFAPHRRARSSKTPSLLVVLLGLQHFTATPKVPLASPASKPCSIFCASCS